MPEPEGKVSTTASERLNMAQAYDRPKAPDPDDWQAVDRPFQDYTNGVNF